MSSTDLIFHVLDIQARDMRIESEEEDVRELVYESHSDEDDEVKHSRKKKKVSTSKPREFVIHLFGATELGTPVRCDVTGFRPTLYLRLPEEKTSLAADAIKQYIQSEGIPMGELNIKRITKKIFYGFTANTFYPFLEIDVPSLHLFRNLRSLFLDEHMNYTTKRPLDGAMRGKTVEVFEANLDPMLRFLHTQNIQPCGWISVRDGMSGVSMSESTIIIDCDYQQIAPTKGPRVSAPFLTASWDIECFSMTGDFPVPKRTWKKAAQQILSLGTTTQQMCELLISSLSTTQHPVETLPKGMTPIYCQLKKSLSAVQTKLHQPSIQEEMARIMNMSDAEETMEAFLQKTLHSFVKLVGDPIIQIGTTLTRGYEESTKRHLFVFPDCTPIPGIEVHAYPTEKEMILAWFEWMIQQNPDILIGYNVFGFDESYTWYRAEELGLLTANSPIHEFTRLFELSGEMKLEEKFLSSSAMGDNRMYIWTTQGRLQIDLFHYIKRNNVLPSYKLDEVTKHFMSGKLKKQSYDDCAQILTLEVAGAVKDVKVGRAIALLDDTGETVSEKLVITSVDGNILTIQCWLDDDALHEMEDASKWVIVKDDVSPQDIFRLHRGSAEDRAIVGKYCLQDCDLVIDLYRKLETFNNSMSMANVCSVPVSYIFTRGQGIKIESLIFKQCRERNIVIPVLTIPTQSGSDDSYEGAIVLDPVPGFYANSPIGVCDFASLYPSTIVSENISHDSLLWVKDFKTDGTLIQHQWGSEVYDECEGYAYTDIEFDIIRADPSDGRKHPRKIACGRRICRFAQPLDGSKSTLPQITTWLLNARAAKKKEMKAEKDPERYALLDAEQLAYKLTGNSLYGQLGSSTFKIRLQALAASVTAYGRKQILFAKDAIEKFYGPTAQDPRCAARAMAKVVYGDSVTGNTPLILRDNTTNRIFLKRIDEFYSNGEWVAHHDTKESIAMDQSGVSVWTERGFTPIRQLIRHRLDPAKKLFRIHTHTGIVDVTEDHSLVLPNGNKVKPSDVQIGTELLHNDNVCDEFTNTMECVITENEAFVMGFFVADGSSDVYDCPSGVKASWAINKSDMNLLLHTQQLCPFETKILNTIESSGVYKLVPVGNIKKIAMEYRTLFYNEHREKKIPDVILNAPLPIVQSFWNGFYAGDGDKDANGYIRFDQKGKEIGAGLYLLARRLGYSVSINDRPSKESVFCYTMTKKVQRKPSMMIKKMYELPHPGNEFVYDLETDNHHFGVGPGALIVHNTDSLFVEFNPRNPETGERLTGREARVATIEMTDEAGAFITKTLAPPHDFEFDKCFDPLLMFSKKRYAGNMYENNADDYVHKYMGIALKRRDNAPIVKTIFGGAMKMLLDKRDVVGAFQFVKEKCLELVEGKVSLGQLTVTKSLRADYADPSRIAHKALADRITERDPGNAPAAGDRIGYVYIRAKAGQQASKLQGERIETPHFIKEHGLIPDYQHYIEHQLQNPISQAFGLLLEQVPGYTPQMIKGCPTLEEDLDRYLSFREAKAAELLFQDCLKRFHVTSTRTAVMQMFGANTVITSSVKPKSATHATQATQATQATHATQATQATQATTKKVVQTTMSSFLLDSFLVDNMKKKERAKKKEDAAKSS